MPFDWWLSKEAEELAIDKGYTEEDRAEYRAYIDLFKKVGK